MRFLKELEDKQFTRHENDYPIIFEEIKNKKLFAPSELFKAYRFEKTITQDIYDKKVKQFEIFFHELEKEIKNGKLTYIEFFNKWKQR